MKTTYMAQSYPKTGSFEKVCEAYKCIKTEARQINESQKQKK